MSAISCTVVAILFIVTLSTLTTEAARLVGGRSEVKKVESNKEIQELGRFALEEYKAMKTRTDDKEQNVKGLRFVKVVAAEKQVVSGLKYYLKVEVVNENGQKMLFDSVVVVKPWVKKSRQLVGFAPATTDDVWFLF